MNLRQLRTLAALLDDESFSSVGEKLGLTHSAVSVQMRDLERELGTHLFDRRVRPPALTSTGRSIATLSAGVLEQIDLIRRTAAGNAVPARISIGVVPTALQYLLPALLEGLRRHFPDVQVDVVSALSGELANSVASGDLDFAISTSPGYQQGELVITDIAHEKLYAVAPADNSASEEVTRLLQSAPFIAFKRNTWLGQQIALRLHEQGISVVEGMEVDSLDAIETLVAGGFGVSIVPQRVFAPSLHERLHCLPFGAPQTSRTLALIQSASSVADDFDRSIRTLLTQMTGQA